MLICQNSEGLNGMKKVVNPYTRW